MTPGVKVRVYNLGTAGALVSDQYFIAARLAGDADLLAVQLTYHTFSPAGRNRGTQRFPELPEILDEAVSPEVASVLDIDPTRFFNLGGAVDSALGRRWVLFREHEEVAARLFDRPARDELHSRWQDLTRSTPARPPLAPSLAPNTRFDELDPARQTEIAGRYADLADYEIERDDPELRMLDLLCARLEHRKTSAVFFISPLNTKALEDFGVFDRRRYEANVSMIRSVVEKHGLVFIDWNQPELALPTGLFADITHTTDAGSALFAQRLYGSLKPQLDGRGARE